MTIYGYPGHITRRQCPLCQRRVTINAVTRRYRLHPPGGPYCTASGKPENELEVAL